MTITTLQWRLLAAALTSLWIALAVALLATYRHAATDPSVVLAFVPAVVAAVAALRGDVGRSTRGIRGWPALAGLGAATGAGLLLVPTLIGFLSLRGDALRRPVAPGAEAWYAVTLALLLTSAFAAIGLVPRLAASRGALATLGATLVVAPTLLGGAAVGAALAGGPRSTVADARVPGASGQQASGDQTSRDRVPAGCRGTVRVMPAAGIRVEATLAIDGATIGRVEVSGGRQATEERWQADVSTPWRGESVGYVGWDRTAWRRHGSGGWETVPVLPAGALDRAVATGIEEAERQVAVEDLGEELVAGEPTRRCRAAIRGPGALRALPALRPLVGAEIFSDERPLELWQGELEWWLSPAGELAMASVTIHGLPGRDWPRKGIQAKLDARLVADPATAPDSIAPPR